MTDHVLLDRRVCLQNVVRRAAAALVKYSGDSGNNVPRSTSGPPPQPPKAVVVHSSSYRGLMIGTRFRCRIQNALAAPKFKRFTWMVGRHINRSRLYGFVWNINLITHARASRASRYEILKKKPRVRHSPTDGRRCGNGDLPVNIDNLRQRRHVWS